MPLCVRIFVDLPRISGPRRRRQTSDRERAASPFARLGRVRGRLDGALWRGRRSASDRRRSIWGRDAAPPAGKCDVKALENGVAALSEEAHARVRRFVEEKALQYEEFLPVTYEHLSASSKKRLVQLLGSDITWSPGDADEKPEFATTFEEAFEKFCESCPEWKNLDNVFWKEDAGYLVMRCQRSGLCYMHAVVVFVHYLVALWAGQNNHTMIDIGAYMRDCFSSIALRDQICSNRGRRSIDRLRSMGGFSYDDLDGIPIRLKSKSEVDFNSEESSRPALVSRFRVEEAFKGASILSHPSTVLIGGWAGTKSMLLIGVRQAKDGVHYLLREWSARKFFIESVPNIWALRTRW